MYLANRIHNNIVVAPSFNTIVTVVKLRTLHNVYIDL